MGTPRFVVTDWVQGALRRPYGGSSAAVCFAAFVLCVSETGAFMAGNRTAALSADPQNLPSCSLRFVCILSHISQRRPHMGAPLCLL